MNVCPIKTVFGKNYIMGQTIGICGSITNKAFGENYNMRKGSKHTEEFKKKMSSNMKGKRCGKNNSFYGKHHTEETKILLSNKNSGYIFTEEQRKNVSDAVKGEKNGFFGKKHSESTCNQISESLKKYYIENPERLEQVRKQRKGKPSPNKGKKLSDEHCKKLSESHKGKPSGNKGKKVSIESRKKMSDAHSGKKIPIEQIEKISNANRGQKRSKDFCERLSLSLKGKYCGEKASGWKGGISFFPYCPKFNKNLKEKVRDEYNRQCFLCGKHEKDNITKTGRNIKLHIHHVDYDKEQGCNGKHWRLIPLCNNCHGKTNNKKRDFWQQHLNSLVSIYNIKDYMIKWEEYYNEI